MLFAAIMTAGMTVSAQEVQSELMTDSVAAVETEGIAAALSDKWSDFQMQIDDDVYQFPMMYDAFEAYGWTSDETDEELEPNQYGMFQFAKDELVATVYVLNLGLNTQPAKECIVGGMTVDSFYWETDQNTVTLPGGIVRGQADGAAIEAAYGIPSDTYDGEYYTEYTYETDYQSSLELQVSKETGVLDGIDIKNFVEPEGFDAGEASDEVPEAVAAYEKPAALSDDPSVYEIEMEGNVYTMPVPVSVLIADGWEIDESQSEPVIAAGSSGWVTLRNGGQEIDEIVRNPESYATIPQNCWVETLGIGEYSLNVDGTLPGGIKNGMSEEEFLQILDDAGISYEADGESGDYKYYTYNEKAYDQCFQVTVYTGTGGSFEQNTIMEISCRNTID